MNIAPRNHLIWPPPPKSPPVDEWADDWAESVRPVVIKVEWVLADERWQPSEVTVTPLAGSGELTASRLHSIPFGTVFGNMRRSQSDPTGRSDIDPDHIAELRRQWSEPRPGRPRTYELEHWLSVRGAYYRGRDVRAIRKTIAEEFNVSEGTAKNWCEKLRGLKLID